MIDRINEFADAVEALVAGLREEWPLLLAVVVLFEIVFLAIGLFWGWG